MTMMKAAAFIEPNRIEIIDKAIPEIGPNDALIKNQYYNYLWY